jgi:4-hydroxy-tetrahydrodipicolinate synthase
VSDGLRAGAAGWCTAASWLRPQPRSDLESAVPAGELSRAHPIYAEVKPLLGFIVADGQVTTAKAGLAFLGAGVGDPRRPPPPLDDDGRTALKKVLADH